MTNIKCILSWIDIEGSVNEASGHRSGGAWHHNEWSLHNMGHGWREVDPKWMRGQQARLVICTDGKVLILKRNMVRI